MTRGVLKKVLDHLKGNENKGHSSRYYSYT